jgi:predicted Zn-dependent peptidase
MASFSDYIEIDNHKIPLILERLDDIPIIQFDIVFENAGSIADDIAGTSYFVSRILNEGTKKNPFNKFYEKLEQNAISLSISSNREILTFSISSLREDFVYATELLAELFKKPNITKEAIAKVALLSRSAILEREDDFDSVAKNQLNTIMFKDTALENPHIGDLESIKKIDKKIIKKFIKSHITLDNAILVLGGDFDKDDIKAIKNSIKHIKISKQPTQKDIKISTKISTKTIYKDTKQAYIYFASPFDMKSNDKDMYKAKIAMFILGSSGFGSRLMEEIRVKQGLAYSVYAYLNTQQHYSLMQGYLQTKLENEKKAIELIKNEVSKFIKKGASKKELDSAKKFILGSQPLRNETLSQRLEYRFSEYYKKLGKDSQNRFLEDVKNITLKELNDFIKKQTSFLNLSFSIVTKK